MASVLFLAMPVIVGSEEIDHNIRHKQKTGYKIKD